MKATYQPDIIEKANYIIGILEIDDFFNKYEIKNIEAVREKLCRELTKKFIENGLDNDPDYFTREEKIRILKEIIQHDTLLMLKDDGIVESYSDENTEETFFLTEKGKDWIKN